MILPYSGSLILEIVKLDSHNYNQLTETQDSIVCDEDFFSNWLIVPMMLQRIACKVD